MPHNKLRGVCRINFGEVRTSKPLRVRGLSSRKLITFDPFVNCIMVMMVNFLDFVIPPFFSWFFFRLAFLTGVLQPFCIRTWIKLCVQLELQACQRLCFNCDLVWRHYLKVMFDLIVNGLYKRIEDRMINKTHIIDLENIKHDLYTHFNMQIHLHIQGS